MQQELLGQALRQIAPLGVFVEHVGETLFHLCLNSEGFPLHILHLLLDRREAPLEDRGVEQASIGEHSTRVGLLSVASVWTHLPAGGASQRVLLHDQDLFELFDLCLYVSAAGLRVLIEELHIIELLIERHHHLEHHAPVLVEDVLFDRCAAVVARLVLVHYVVDHFAHLLLIGLKHLHLAFHELGLAVHERLGDHIHILCRHELLPHLVQEGVHFIVGDLLQIRLMVLDCGGHIGLLRSEALVQGLGSRRSVDFPELQNRLVVVNLFILFNGDDFGLRGEVTLRSGIDEPFRCA